MRENTDQENFEYGHFSRSVGVGGVFKTLSNMHDGAFLQKYSLAYWLKAFSYFANKTSTYIFGIYIIQTYFLGEEISKTIFSVSLDDCK